MDESILLGLKFFLGFRVDALFEEALTKANPYLVSVFIGQAEYLQEVVHQGQRYFGKFLTVYPTIIPSGK